MQEVVVELIRVSKKYGRRQLFADINQRIGPGECVGITGPNGSGKSTLIKIIAGLLRPSAGIVQVQMDGKVMDAEKRMACFGLISPELLFYQAMTGYENLQFLVRARGLALADDQLLNCLETVGLSGRQQERVGTYSTGMRQRLKFAVLEALRPPVWLLDEPASNLDEEGKKLVKRLVDNALAQQAAVVIATNDLEEVRYAGQKIALA